MTHRRVLAVVAAVAMLATACGDDEAAEPTPTATSTSTTSTTSTPTTSTPTTSTPTTTPPEPSCAVEGPLALLDEALAAARLSTPSEWSADPQTTSFASRTTSGEEYAARLGLDCGTLLGATGALGDSDWLAVVAWTGSRAAFAVQTTAAPSTPYTGGAYVQNPVTEEPGEFVADDMSTWAASGPDGESIVLGHVDFSLGAAAKDWEIGPRLPFEEEVNLASEQHGIDALVEAGMRNVGIAQSPERGSEEGYIQFVSTTGQISVADVAPTGWFDPMAPRYFGGDTRVESVDGVDVRITLPLPDDNLGFAIAAEVAFACADFVWILEPPFNGTVDEMEATATAIVATSECQAG
jgi:hypothetical protein